MTELSVHNNLSRNRMTVSNYTVSFCAISIFCIISTFFLPGSNSAESFYFILSLASLIELLLFSYCLYKITGYLISFATVFVWILYLFHFGQVILLGLFPTAASELTIVLNYFSFDDCSYGLRILNIGFVCICLGMLLSSKKCTQSVHNTNDITVDNLFKRYKNKAMAVFFITFPIKFYIDIRCVLLTLTAGFDYSKHWYYSISDFIVTFGNISQACLGVLLIIYKSNPKKQFRIFVLSLAYFVLIMLSGRRSESVALICILLYIFFVTRNIKIKPIKLVMYGVLGYFLLAFFYSIVYMRNQSGFLLSSFLDKFWRTLTSGENVIFQALREYGNTGYTAICVLTKWLPQHAPSFGKSYIFGLTAILPNITGIAGQLTRESVFGEAMQSAGALSSHYTNIGGSLFGEAFFNFGIVGGFVFLILIGTLIGLISRKVIYAINDRIDFKIFGYVALMIAILYWTRSYFSANIRDVVWTFLLFYFMRNVRVKV